MTDNDRNTRPAADNTAIPEDAHAKEDNMSPYGDNAAETILGALPEQPAEIIALPEKDTSDSDDPYADFLAEQEDALPAQEPDNESAPDTSPVLPGNVFAYRFPVPPSRGVAARIAAKTCAAGLDITPRYIRLCGLAKGINYKNPQQPFPLLYGEYEQGEVTSWDELHDNRDDTANHLKALAKKLKLTGAYTNISLPMSAAVLRTMPLANMSADELDEMIAENENFFYPVLGESRSPEDYTLTYDVVMRDQAADMMYLNVVAYHNERFDFFKTLAERSGFTPVSAEIREIALLRAAVQAVDDDDACVGALQIGPEENHFLLTYNGMVTAKEIIINDWDRVALVNGDDQLLQSLASRYTEEMMNAMALFQSDCNAPPPEYVVLSSYIPLSSMFIRVLSDAVPEVTFKTLTRPEQDNAGFVLAEMFPGEDEESALYKKPLSGDACAIAMAGRHPVAAVDGGITPAELNFFPGKAAFAKALVQRYYGRAVAAVAAVAVVLAVGAGTFHAERQRAMLSAGISQMKADSAGYTAVIDEAKALKQFTDTLKEMNSLPEVLPLNQTRVLQAVRRVHGTIPSGVWLERFDFAYPADIVMVGKALQDHEILEFMNRLSGGGVFASVTLKMMEAQEEKSRANKSTAADSAAEPKERLIKSFRIDAALAVSGASEEQK